jgi:hypothetical protein
VQQTIHPIASGSYTVTIGDGTGCLETVTSPLITVNSGIATITGDTTLCAGDTSVLDAGAGQTWLWSSGDTTRTISVNTADTYSVTVTNANGCDTYGSVNTHVNPLPVPTITGGTVVCSGSSLTLSTASASSYLWSTGASTQSISVNNSGTYTVTVTDANGCTGSSLPVNTTLINTVTQLNNGSASNAFTNISNYTNPIAVDNSLNTIVFIHRNNASLFGGTSGNLRYDLSTDGGSTWTNNLGVLNPIQSNPARYPQVAIFNPAGNTVPSNSYLTYLAPALSGSLFSASVSGVRKLDGTGNTEHYNQVGAGELVIPRSMVEGAPGIFWAIDNYVSGSVYKGFRIYKGVMNGSSDIAWSAHDTLTP